MTRLRAAALATAALALAGCGSSDRGGASLPDGAAKAPADAPAFVSLNTDSSEQWAAAIKLASRFPALADVIDLEKVRQLESAAGPEVDLVWTDFANAGNNVVGLTKPTALGRLKAALSGDVVFADLSDGWVAVAGDQAALDRFQQLAGGDKLDGDKDFRDAVGKLDADSPVRAWIRGGFVQAALDRALAGAGAASEITHDLGHLRVLAGTAKAKTDGVAIELDGVLDPAADPATFSPSLPRAVPAGALLYVSTTSLDDSVRIILRMVGESRRNFDTQLEQVQGVLGLSLEDDVYPLLDGESALAVYRGGRIPPILFLQKVDDEQKADGLLRRVTAVARLGGDVRTDSVELGGKTVQRLTFGGVTIYDGVARGKIFVTNTAGLAEQAVSGPTRSLGDDAGFRAARDAAGLPDEVAAFAYGDLENGLPFVFRLAEQSGSVVSPAARANTKPLETALVYLVRDGDALRMSGFAAIK